VEGQNLILYRRSAEGQFSRYRDIIAELIQLKTVVIQTAAFPAALWPQAASITVPIVSLFNFDPVEEGLASSLARPGGNITGLTISAGLEIDGKRTALLKEILPGAARIALTSQRCLTCRGLHRLSRGPHCPMASSRMALTWGSS
jgi:putative ABC transport system substrate-binding protein